MQISDNGIRFIENFEKFRANVYSDVGHPCIGYGHDLQPGESFPDGLTQEQAEMLLVSDLDTRFEPSVNALIPDGCTQNQFNALCDFAYNLGTGALRTMLAHGWEQVAEQIPHWDHIKGIVNDELTARRQAEVELFNAV